MKIPRPRMPRWLGRKPEPEPVEPTVELPVIAERRSVTTPGRELLAHYRIDDDGKVVSDVPFGPAPAPPADALPWLGDLTRPGWQPPLQTDDEYTDAYWKPPADDPLATVAFNIPAMLLGEREGTLDAIIASMTHAENLETELDTANRIIALLVLQLGGTAYLADHDVVAMQLNDGELRFDETDGPHARRFRISYTPTNTKESTPA